MEIHIERTSDNRRRTRPADESTLGFGRFFSDHMFRMTWRDGIGWGDATIAPYGPIEIDPAGMVLHYGQEIFEGLKAYRVADGGIRLFRPEMNFARMNRSAARICLPEIPVADAIAAVETLLRTDADWIPSAPGTSLYIRPTMIATEAGLGVRPAGECLFFIITGPVGAYYARGLEPVRILVESRFVRAAPGGLGEAKTGANYAASLLAAREAKEQGFDQVLWLDAVERRFIEEVGTMNIFFVIDDEVITPALGGSILPGITRDSALTLCQEFGLKVAERPVSIDDIAKAADDGRLSEAFGTGTAAVISPVGLFAHCGREIVVGDGGTGPVAKRLYDEITGIQYGTLPDRFGWVHRVT